MESVKEIVRDLLDVIDNEGGVLHGNRRELAMLDAESADKYVDDLQEQVEETEYIFYNSEEWIDKVTSLHNDKLEEQMRSELELTDFDKRLLSDIIEDYTKDLQKALHKEIMVELAKVPQVYTR